MTLRNVWFNSTKSIPSATSHVFCSRSVCTMCEVDVERAADAPTMMRHIIEWKLERGKKWQEWLWFLSSRLTRISSETSDRRERFGREMREFYSMKMQLRLRWTWRKMQTSVCEVQNSSSAGDGDDCSCADRAKHVKAHEGRPERKMVLYIHNNCRRFTIFYSFRLITAHIAIVFVSFSIFHMFRAHICAPNSRTNTVAAARAQFANADVRFRACIWFVLIVWYFCLLLTLRSALALCIMYLDGQVWLYYQDWVMSRSVIYTFNEMLGIYFSARTVFSHSLQLASILFHSIPHIS